MPKAYPIELRERVMRAVELEEKSITDISKIFNVCRATIYLWKGLKKETGSINSKSGYQKGLGMKIVNLDEFKLFIEQNNSKTVSELADLWEGKVSRGTIYNMIKRIKYT